MQAWARERRYGAARELAAPRGAAIATGHTATDQVETVLYRLAASPGPPRAARDARRATAASCARCWRSRARRRPPTAPSAGCRGARTRATTRDAYARNRVRAELLPALRGCTRRPRPTSCARSRCCATRPRCSTPPSDAALTDEQAALAALPPALARLCLQRLADDAAAPAPAPAVGARAAELLALGAAGGQRGARPRRRPARGGRVRPPALRARAAPPAPAAARGSRSPAAPPSPAASSPARSARSSRSPTARSTATRSPRPLEVRAWRAGDRMRPLGLGGSRSLQDLFTDRKVPRARRARAARGRLRRRDRLGAGRRHRRALPGRRGHARAAPGWPGIRRPGRVT